MVEFATPKTMNALPCVTALLFACVAPAQPESAESTDSCATWNAEGFFKRATPEEVEGCILAGSSATNRNNDRQSPICMAAIHTTDPEVIATLIRHGALANDWCWFPGWFPVALCPESTPSVLHVAVGLNPSVAVAEVLILARAQVNARAGPPGWTPLNIVGLWHASDEMKELLVSHGGRYKNPEDRNCYAKRLAEGSSVLDVNALGASVSRRSVSCT